MLKINILAIGDDVIIRHDGEIRRGKVTIVYSEGHYQGNFNGRLLNFSKIHIRTEYQVFVEQVDAMTILVKAHMAKYLSNADLLDEYPPQFGAVVIKLPCEYENGSVEYDYTLRVADLFDTSDLDARIEAARKKRSDAAKKGAETKRTRDIARAQELLRGEGLL